MTFAPTIAYQYTPAASRGILHGGSLVAGVEVSVIISESHNLSAQATKQAIESGAQVTDHVILQPYEVQIVYEVSNANAGSSRAKDVFETFKNMLEARETLTLATEHYIYDNMVLTSVTPLHSAPFKGRLQFTATLQRVNQIRIEVVGRQPKVLSKGTTQKTASAETNGGTQNGGEVKKSMAEKIRRKSLGLSS